MTVVAWWLNSKHGSVAHAMRPDWRNAACDRVVFHTDAAPAPDGFRRCKRCVAALGDES